MRFWQTENKRVVSSDGEIPWHNISYCIPLWLRLSCALRCCLLVSSLGHNFVTVSVCVHARTDHVTVCLTVRVCVCVLLYVLCLASLFKLCWVSPSFLMGRVSLFAVGRECAASSVCVCVPVCVSSVLDDCLRSVLCHRRYLLISVCMQKRKPHLCYKTVGSLWCILRHGQPVLCSVCLCVLCVCVSVRHWKGEEIDQHREERVHQQRLDGGCVREREGEKERGLSLHTPAAVSHFGQAAADRE